MLCCCRADQKIQGCVLQVEKETYAQAHTDSFLFKAQWVRPPEQPPTDICLHKFIPCTCWSVDYILHALAAKSCSVKFNLLIQNRFVWEVVLTEACFYYQRPQPIEVQRAVVYNYKQWLSAVICSMLLQEKCQTIKPVHCTFNSYQHNLGEVVNIKEKSQFYIPQRIVKWTALKKMNI